MVLYGYMRGIKVNIDSTNSLVLAYLGDSVYELLVRDYFVKQKISKVNALQNKVTKYVSAKGQAKIINYLIRNSFFRLTKSQSFFVL